MKPVASRLARLQQGLVVATIAAAVAWAWAWWPRHPLVALLGAAALLGVHAFVLAVEFVLVATVGGDAATPVPRTTDLVRAWWRETVQGWRVFAWRQPFAWRRVPDRLQGAPGLVGIVFVHGFVCNRGFWVPWLARARARGHPFIAVNLEPVFGHIDGYAAAIENAVERLTAATGRPPALVCHSMGGLAARAWLQQGDATGRIAHLVTIGTPHGGTWLARFSSTANGHQMRLGSNWLRRLDGATAALAGHATCWYSNCDNVVFPPSTATLPGADNRFVPGAAHVDLAFHPHVIDGTFACVRDLPPPRTSA